jgi:hypothetical protein
MMKSKRVRSTRSTNGEETQLNQLCFHTTIDPHLPIKRQEASASSKLMSTKSKLAKPMQRQATI